MEPKKPGSDGHQITRRRLCDVKGLQGNIADQADAEKLVNLAISTHGMLDVLVNNAGIMDLFQGVGEVTNDVWERVIGVNLNGQMFTSRCIIKQQVYY